MEKTLDVSMVEKDRRKEKRRERVEKREKKMAGTFSDCF